jgi:hypothetical protein
MRRWLLLGLLVACDAGAPPVSGPRADEVAAAEIREAKRSAQREIDALARAVLERYIVDPTSVPDNQLLEHERTIVIDRDLEYDGTGSTLTTAALPLGPFAIRSAEERQADADRQNTYVHNIFIHSLKIEGDTATFWVGVHVTLPNRPEGSGTCCCSEEQIYIKRGGSWVYSKTTDSICS